MVVSEIASVSNRRRMNAWAVGCMVSIERGVEDKRGEKGAGNVSDQAGRKSTPKSSANTTHSGDLHTTNDNLFRLADDCLKLDRLAFLGYYDN